jgi:hypothetical protein
MNKEVQAIVQSRLKRLTEISPKHNELICELLTFYCQEIYTKVSCMEVPLDITAVATIDYILADALSALLGRFVQYIALLEGENGDLPRVYINKGYSLINEELESRRERISDIEREKNKLKPEPNWPYPCIHCGKKTVYYSDYCGRALDESMILKFECLSCRKSW